MKTRRRKITILISVVALVILLAGVRMWLPHFLLNKVNNALTRLDGYNGVARSVEVSLLRGAYTIHDITLHKKGGHITEPFFKATSIRIGIDWKSLLKGKLASELSASAPALHYVNGRDEASTQIRISNQWPMVLSSLLPLPLNRFTVVNGKVQFQDEQSTPAVALFMDSIALRGVNLLNIDQKQNSLPATVMGTGLHPTGTVALSLRLAPSPALPAFEMHAEINTLELPAMQNFINAYSHCDVRKGTLSLFVEAASKGSSITGSVRPVLTDLDADELKGTRDAAIREYPASPVTWKIPQLPQGPVAEFKVEGVLRNDSTNLWNVVGETLRHASYYAMIPTIRHSVALKQAAAARKQKPRMGPLTAKAEENKGLFKRLFRKSETDHHDRSSRGKN